VVAARIYGAEKMWGQNWQLYSTNIR